MVDVKEYLKRIKTLLDSRKFSKAGGSQEWIKTISKSINLLICATDVFRASGNCQKSLEYSELLIAIIQTTGMVMDVLQKIF